MEDCDPWIKKKKEVKKRYVLTRIRALKDTRFSFFPAYFFFSFFSYLFFFWIFGNRNEMTQQQSHRRSITVLCAAQSAIVHILFVETLERSGCVYYQHCCTASGETLSFACSINLGSSTFTAAESENKKVIGKLRSTVSYQFPYKQ